MRVKGVKYEDLWDNREHVLQVIISHECGFVERRASSLAESF